ncbi:alpha/beta hydrolase [Pedobacter deserti]|uniref:alpha/beta hydrolase n=1 Tax=Pedobacter deserti TaxID=2817382 RepID=UPI00210C52A9|nr:alpha/beta hydrolase [Pedobacter sp. SYSU D00382]
MRLFVCAFLITFFYGSGVVYLHAQDKTLYKADKEIGYYDDARIKADSYLASRCKLSVYYPANRKNYGTVIWFHGGGLTGGNIEIPDALKEKGLAVVGVTYRLSPQAKGASIIEDAAAAIAWTFKNIGRYGGSDSLIFVSGHSAGAYLAMMVGLNKDYLKPYGIDANRIAGLIPFSGQCITHFTIRNESKIAETQPIVDRFAPLYHVRGDAPPMLLITGNREMEMLGRYEENAYMARMMKLTGHKETVLFELDGYGHNMAYPAFPLLLNEVKRITDLKAKSRALPR